MAHLVDTNILVYRYDPRDSLKQDLATQILRSGSADGSLALAHQSIVEFVAATTRPCSDLGDAPLLSLEEACIEAEDLMLQFPVIYPGRDVLLTAMRGTAMYGFSWFDAHLWAYAEVHGFPEIITEDFEHGRHYGSVRVCNPFLSATGVQELPTLYAP